MTDADRECFACAGPRPIQERLGQWYRPRLACDQHRRNATFANGATVADFTATGSEAGSAVGYFLGPLVVDGYRGWLTSIAGGWGVFEERFAADAYVEWLLQHGDGWVASLWMIHEHRTALAEATSVGDLVMALKNAPMALDALSKCAWSWVFARACLAMVPEGGVTRLDLVPPLPDVPHRPLEHSLEALGSLLDLGARRFAHLQVDPERE